MSTRGFHQGFSTRQLEIQDKSLGKGQAGETRWTEVSEEGRPRPPNTAEGGDSQDRKRGSDEGRDSRQERH